MSIHSSLVKLIIDNHIYFILSLQHNQIMILSRTYHIEYTLYLCFDYSSWDWIAMFFPKIKDGPYNIIFKNNKIIYIVP